MQAPDLTNGPGDPASAASYPAPLDMPLKLLLARLTHGVSPAALVQSYNDWLVHLAVSPARRTELASSALSKWATWLEACAQAATGTPPASPACGQDARFCKPGWQAPPFSLMAEGFLLMQQWWDEATHGVRGVSRHHEALAAFMARQWLDMACPANFLPTNPEVLHETLRTGGSNLASGALNWLRDAQEVQRGGRARGLEAFKPGEAVACTPGQVVMRNTLAELIQYEPTTPTVKREPVLMVPSWIMKYYILDLTEQDSLVRWLVARGHTVFMVSWRNPGSEDAGLGMDDYLQHGVMEPLRTIQDICPGTGIQAMGYCLGGTLLAIAAALLGARKDSALHSVSLVAGQVDFGDPGELGLFIDESQIAFLEDVMAEHGYLDGRQMAGAFQLINSKDLVWSKLVHEYLMGARTPMTALRAWNADATRMPARMHSEYLRRLYLQNDLAEGRYTAFGQVVRLDDIRVPLFVLGTERDHVSPWPSVYKVLRLARAPATFVLCSGGHNVGIVNPPEGPSAHPKASYRLARVAAGHAPADPRQLLHGLEPVAGSWWPAWEQWLRRHADGQVKARKVHGLRDESGQLERAPGRYVHGA